MHCVSGAPPLSQIDLSRKKRKKKQTAQSISIRSESLVGQDCHLLELINSSEAIDKETVQSAGQLGLTRWDKEEDVPERERTIPQEVWVALLSRGATATVHLGWAD